jgi:hypothetical protein
MGSQVIEALTEQKGNQITNPAGISPDPSRPIQQIPPGASTNTGTSKPLQQRLQLVTKPAGHSGSPPGGNISRPIEQIGEIKFAPDFPDPAKSHVMEQIRLVTGNHPDGAIDPAAETPIQLIDFKQETLAGDTLLTTRPVEQFIIASAGSSVSRPVELVPRIQNSIQVTQFDFVDVIFPPCNSVKNATTTNILWRIKDFGFPFDTSSLIFTVKGIQVQDRPEFTVTNLPTGLQLFYDPPEDFDFEEEVVCSITISDTAVPANTFFLRCIWSTVPDVRPPFFRSITPACNSTGVDVLANVEFDVLDFGEGVDPDSIRLSIEGVTVCSGLTLDPVVDQDFTTISGIPVGTEVTGYHVTYEHPNDPWRYGSNVTISMEAQDLSVNKNRALFVCAFDVEESAPPVFTNLQPEPCESFIDNRTGLSFEVYGVEHGIDISTLEVRVDNTLRKVFVRPRILRTE